MEMSAKEALLRMDKIGMKIDPTHGGDSLLQCLEKLRNLSRDSAIRRFNCKNYFSTGGAKEQATVEWRVHISTAEACHQVVH